MENLISSTIILNTGTCQGCGLLHSLFMHNCSPTRQIPTLQIRRWHSCDESWNWWKPLIGRRSNHWSSLILNTKKTKGIITFLWLKERKPQITTVLWHTQRRYNTSRSASGKGVDLKHEQHRVGQKGTPEALFPANPHMNQTPSGTPHKLL